MKVFPKAQRGCRSTVVKWRLTTTEMDDLQLVPVVGDRFQNCLFLLTSVFFRKNFYFIWPSIAGDEWMIDVRRDGYRKNTGSSSVYQCTVPIPDPYELTAWQVQWCHPNSRLYIFDFKRKHYFYETLWNTYEYELIGFDIQLWFFTFHKKKWNNFQLTLSFRLKIDII